MPDSALCVPGVFHVKLFNISGHTVYESSIAVNYSELLRESMLYCDDNLSSLDLRSIDLYNVHLDYGVYLFNEFCGSTVKGCSFIKSDMFGTIMSDATFINCDFSETNLTNSTMVDTKFYGCYFQEATLSNCLLSGTEFTDCSVKYGVTEKWSSVFLLFSDGDTRSIRNNRVSFDAYIDEPKHAEMYHLGMDVIKIT